MAIAQLKAYDEFVEFMTSTPTLEAISQFRLSDESEARIHALLDANESRKLTPEEEAELDEYLRLEHIMRKAKIRAFEKLSQQS